MTRRAARALEDELLFGTYFVRYKFSINDLAEGGEECFELNRDDALELIGASLSLLFVASWRCPELAGVRHRTEGAQFLDLAHGPACDRRWGTKEIN